MTLLVLFTGALGCNYGIRDISSVPDNPTYNRDIYPLYADHCLVCHSSPPNRGAPAYFRLDIYDDAGEVAGAATMAGTSVHDVEIGKMPPASHSGDGVGPNGLKMLQKWLQDNNPQ